MTRTHRLLLRGVLATVARPKVALAGTVSLLAGSAVLRWRRQPIRAISQLRGDWPDVDGPRFPRRISPRAERSVRTPQDPRRQLGSIPPAGQGHSPRPRSPGRHRPPPPRLLL